MMHPATTIYFDFSSGEMDSGGRPSGKRGNLQFTSSFEGGNIGKVVVKKPKHDYAIFVRPDTENERFRLWFHFKVYLSICYEAQVFLKGTPTIPRTNQLCH